MFGSHVLEVAIGLVFIFLFLSVICSAIKEWISAVFSLRAGNLHSGIQVLLGEPKGSELIKKIYSHPVIKSLSKHEANTSQSASEMRPSYIPVKCFSHALLDILFPHENGRALTSEKLQASINEIDSPQLKKALSSLAHASGDDVKLFREYVGHWFDASMERASGWYKRKAQIIIFFVSLTLTIVANVDCIIIAKTLWQSSVVRSSVVSTVEKNVSGKVLTKKQADQLLHVQLQRLDLPIGWSSQSTTINPMPHTWFEWLDKILGLLFTCIAVSLGAPFWFDALNKLVNLRSTGRQPN